MRYSQVMLLVVAVSISSTCYAAVQIYATGVTPPTTIDYTLNCQADVTIRILPSDSEGTPTGDPVFTAALGMQAKGAYYYCWNGQGSGGSSGYYVARISAQSSPEEAGPIIGPFHSGDPTTEDPEVPPGYTDGFWGIAVNKNPGSPYFGCAYVPHKANKAIYVYEPCGDYRGLLSAAGVSWGTSAPWDIHIAEDDFVFVGDSTNLKIYCIDPDGGGVLSQSPLVGFFSKFFVRRDPDTGRTHVFAGLKGSIVETWVEPDKVTWAPFRTVASFEGTARGMWFSPDRSCFYAAISGQITQWLKNPGTYTYARNVGWVFGTADCSDVEVAKDPATGSYVLWVGMNSAYSAPSNYALYKVDPETAAVRAGFPHVSYANHLCSDAVGNIGVAYGYSSYIWGQRYWAVLSEAIPSESVVFVPFAIAETDASYSIRGQAVGSEANIGGIVTFKGPDFLYVQSRTEVANLSTGNPVFRIFGVKVTGSPSYVSVGDQVQVFGDLAITDGEKVIVPTAVIVHSSGNALPPALAMRSREVGGADYGPHDPGVTNGLGTLNVGLIGQVFGIVTARNESEGWFYIWDGANSGSGSPLDDGSGNLGVRIKSTFACTPGVDFVGVTGVVSTNNSAVPGRVIPQILPTVTPATYTQ